MTKETCDCTVNCGDDPRLKTGKAEPCEHAKTRARPNQVEDGYAKAFYELATLMGIGAQSKSPEHVWHEQMLPRLREAFAPKEPPGEPSRKEKS